ncbi:type II secretion system major pseudopilin GspG [Aestuariivirga sp.]|uniref:type II secretion system major pseudopilin GspG n=1 Tax=Aestuariivirga sp. TaxID=2650926 RepID=UPI0025C22967|nr:type II secretion system major pseudopilin GspG [Aestuariivirga sp.]MCA3554449.1 type II secretion system major pseudopilin GspG [Aestuariivirga sp.]
MISNAIQKQLRGKARRRKGQSGFTLVELLVVLVILVLLASIIGPRVIGYLGSSRAKTAQVQIESMVTALQLFHIDAGRYPTSSEGLAALVKSPGNVAGWNGPYLSKADVPQDPWGRPYIYQSGENGSSFEIRTLGADGKEGGSDENADISN